MPTYGYRCPNGHEYDKFQKISDTSLAACPECGEEGQRVIHGGAGVLFKGSGFYETDYKRADRKEKSGGDVKKGDAPSDSKAKPSDSGEGS